MLNPEAVYLHAFTISALNSVLCLVTKQEHFEFLGQRVACGYKAKIEFAKKIYLSCDFEPF